jgi:glycyl-tRNA synthetase beta subunit
MGPFKPEGANAWQDEPSRVRRLARRRLSGAGTLPPPSEKRAGEAASGEHATKKWVRSRFDDLIKAMVPFVLERIAKTVAPLRADLDQARNVNEALGRQVDKILNELVVLKRDVELEKKLEVQRTKRRTEMLELENSLLRAGRRPDEAREEAEGELPGNFSEWNRHAQ